MEEQELEIIVTNVIIKLGTPLKLKGFHYLRSSILKTISDPECVESITKWLYPDMAKKFKTTESKIERSIRNAVEIGWERGCVEFQQELFGYSRLDGNIRPTNSEFIAMIADKLRLELKTA